METTENTIETVFVENTEPDEEISRSRDNPEWLKPHQWQPGQSGNPGGRPKNTLKEYDRQRFQNMTDSEKEAFLSLIDPAMRYRMAEGNPTEDKQISVRVPIPILGGVSQLPQAEAQAMLEEGTTPGQAS